MNDAVIISAVRTPVGKAPNGALRTTRPDEMGAVVIKSLLERVPALDPAPSVKATAPRFWKA